MAPVTPNPDNIRDFPDAGQFEVWLAAHHDKAGELWLKIFPITLGKGRKLFTEGTIPAVGNLLIQKYRHRESS